MPFLSMQESIEYSIITELVFQRMSGTSKLSDFLRVCYIKSILKKINTI
jgi:hypothetical protein